MSPILSQSQLVLIDIDAALLWQSETSHKTKKMSAIDEILFPILLFIVYLWFALQFLGEETVVISQRKGYANDKPVTTVESASSDREPAQPVAIEREWLENQSLVNLKAIAAELCITPTGDKRSKLTWINAIASATPTTTVLAIDLCFA